MKFKHHKKFRVFLMQMLFREFRLDPSKSNVDFHLNHPELPGMLREYLSQNADNYNIGRGNYDGYVHAIEEILGTK